jgi:hypothetical protein
MYLPHILKRHKESATPSTYYELKKCFRNGGLIIVKQNGMYVSGLLYSKYKDKMQNICSGIYEGKDEYYAKDAVQAARYFLIQWTRQQGCKEIDHGLSNPFMKDGVFTYKRGWGMKAKLNDDTLRSSIFALKLCNFENVVREFLANNPFIFTDSNRLRGLVFLNSENPTEETLKRLHHLYYTRGLSDLVVISYLANNFLGSAFKVTPEGHILEKHPLSEDVPPYLEFVTKLATNMSLSAYLINAKSFSSELT